MSTVESAPSGAERLGQKRPNLPSQQADGRLVYLLDHHDQSPRHPLSEIGAFRKATSMSPILEEVLRPTWAKDLLLPVFEASQWRGAHTLRVGLLSEELARRVGITDEKDVEVLVLAATLHDIGFVNNKRISDGMVNNEGGQIIPDLEDWEGWEGVETHPVVTAFRIAKHHSPAAQVAIGHHGFQGYRSYPIEIQDDGTMLYILRKLLATGDQSDAMFDPARPHVKPETSEKAREIMIRNFGQGHSDLIDFSIDSALRLLGIAELKGKK